MSVFSCSLSLDFSVLIIVALGGLIPFFLPCVFFLQRAVGIVGFLLFYLPVLRWRLPSQLDFFRKEFWTARGGLHLPGLSLAILAELFLTPFYDDLSVAFFCCVHGSILDQDPR